jgi:FkbM family methyltransferase
MNYSYLKSQDEFVYTEIFEWNVYQIKPEEIANTNILDIGGHYGMFDIYCNEYKPSSIVTVEANPNNFIKLLQNTKHIKNLKAINAAVTVSTGQHVTISDEGCQSELNKGELKVTTVSLLDLVSCFDPKEDIILKMDIEGAEYDIFLNTPSNIFKRFKYMYIELHNINFEKNINMLNNYILNLGFTGLWEGHFFVNINGDNVLNEKIKVFKYKRND